MRGTTSSQPDARQFKFVRPLMHSLQTVNAHRSLWNVRTAYKILQDCNSVSHHEFSVVVWTKTNTGRYIPCQSRTKPTDELCSAMTLLLEQAGNGTVYTSPICVPHLQTAQWWVTNPSRRVCKSWRTKYNSNGQLGWPQCRHYVSGWKDNVCYELTVLKRTDKLSFHLIVTLDSCCRIATVVCFCCV